MLGAKITTIFGTFSNSVRSLISSIFFARDEASKDFAPSTYKQGRYEFLKNDNVDQKYLSHYSNSTYRILLYFKTKKMHDLFLIIQRNTIRVFSANFKTFGTKIRASI